MNSTQLTGLAIAGGIIYAAWKFGNPMVKGAAVSVAAVAIAKKLPYLNAYI